MKPDFESDLAHDRATLARIFRQIDWIGQWGLPALGLRMEPAQLVTLGLLRPSQIGRWDRGYAAGPGLEVEPCSR